MVNLIKLNLDTLGTSTDNKIVGEVHDIGVSATARIVVPSYGAFFYTGEDFIITDLSTNQPLTLSQYYPSEYLQVPSEKYGKEIYQVIVILDTTVSANISLTYQALGGDYGGSMDAILQLIDNLALDNRPVNFADILHKPLAYPPSQHLHDIGDVYGFEYLVNAVNGLRTAIEAGDAVAARNVYQYIDSQLAAVNSAILSLAGAGGGALNPVSKATQTIAEAGTDDTLWMSALMVAKEINAQLSSTKVTDYDFLAYYRSL